MLGQRYVAHVGRWDRALGRARMTWLDRAVVRWSLRRRYRGLGLLAPRGLFARSPLSAAVAAGVAAGVRWLQRHPELHTRVCGARLYGAGLAEAVRATVEEVAAGFVPALDAGHIIRLIHDATSAAAVALPRFARTEAEGLVTAETAPLLAAEDGRLDELMLGQPIELVCDVLLAGEAPVPQLAFAVPRAVDDALAGVACPRTFLGRVLAAWLGNRRSSATWLSSVVLAAFAERRRVGGAARDVLRIVRGADDVFVHADFWIAADRPARRAYDARGRLHDAAGPAVTWRDGAGLGFLHGVHVDMRLLTQPLTLADVLHTANTEVRRTLIERYERGDPGRFIRDAEADVIAIDYDRLGNRQRLLRFELAGDEPYVAVEVTNATPEPDGSHRRYILRVPPTITSCREAVAWTFGMTAREYDPDIET
ncbi:MAG TPA: hypothetical protein VGD80_21050 [Kofleriaceae bacterium]